MAAQNVPAEIWGKIFELSCTDSGQTGRSLALVSRYIHTVSKPYQYQSIALDGPHAIEHFANFLVNDTQRHRVKYLLMSTFEPDPSVLEIIHKGTLCRAYELLSFPSPSQQLSHSDQTLKVKTNHTILADMHRILELIAPSVLNLHIVMDFYREEIFFPMTFPVLEELSIQGPFHDHYDCNDEFCDTLYPPIPSLRRLYLTDVFTCLKDRTYLAIRHYAPCLTHLRIQCADGYLESSRTFLRQLLPSGSEELRDEEEFHQGCEYGSYWKSKDGDERDAGAKRPHFPDTLQHILFQPGPGRPRGKYAATYMMDIMRYTVLRELEKCAEDDPRITLSEESTWIWPYSREHGYLDGKGQWLSRISGGAGAWRNV